MDDLDGVKVKPEGALGVEQEEGGVYLYTRLEPSEDEFKFEIFPTEQVLLVQAVPVVVFKLEEDVTLAKLPEEEPLDIPITGPVL